MREYNDVDIELEGPEIKRIGHNLDSAAFQPERIIDASRFVVIPGLVNTHHHFFQTLTRCIPRVQNSELFNWLTDLYEIWRELTPEAVYVSSLLGFTELIRTGCTTTSDQHYLFPRDAAGDLIDMQIKAAQEIGIRFHPTRGSMSRGKSNEGLPPDEVVQTDDEILADSERLIRRYHDPEKFSMCRLVLAPCSPFSVTEKLLKETAALARRYDKVLLHTHIAETRDEDEYCREVYGMRPVEFMESVDWLEDDCWYAHCVHVNAEEIDLFARRGVGVAHCPTSNMLLGSGIAPIPEMLEAGVNVSLAVDGSASNDTSNMLLEVRQAMLLHRVNKGASAMSARRALRMATQGGAAVMGRDDIGSLAPGQAADLVLINIDRIDFAGALSDPVAALVYCGDSFVVDTVIINGEVVLENGRLIHLDEDKIVHDANRVSAEMIKKASKRTGIDYGRARKE